MKRSTDVKHISGMKSARRPPTNSGQNQASCRLHHAAINRIRLMTEQRVLLSRLKEVARQLGFTTREMGESLAAVQKLIPRPKMKNGTQKMKNARSNRRTIDFEF